MLPIQKGLGRWCLAVVLGVATGTATAGGKERLQTFLDGVQSLQAVIRKDRTELTYWRAIQAQYRDHRDLNLDRGQGYPLPGTGGRL